MSIKYTYEIVAVDSAARCMEVVYSADGHQTMHIGARLPFEGEALEDVIRAFAPVPLWEEQSKAVVAPSVGVSGTITPAPVPVVVDGAELPTPASGDLPQSVL
jgi:hypothetical protein